MTEALKDVQGAVLVDLEPTEIAEPSEAALDFPTRPVAPQLAAVLTHGPLPTPPEEPGRRAPAHAPHRGIAEIICSNCAFRVSASRAWRVSRKPLDNSEPSFIHRNFKIRRPIAHCPACQLPSLMAWTLERGNRRGDRVKYR